MNQFFFKKLDHHIIWLLDDDVEWFDDDDDDDDGDWMICLDDDDKMTMGMMRLILILMNEKQAHNRDQKQKTEKSKVLLFLICFGAELLAVGRNAFYFDDDLLLLLRAVSRFGSVTRGPPTSSSLSFSLDLLGFLVGWLVVECCFSEDHAFTANHHPLSSFFRINRFALPSLSSSSSLLSLILTPFLVIRIIIKRLSLMTLSLSLFSFFLSVMFVCVFHYLTADMEYTRIHKGRRTNR